MECRNIKPGYGTLIKHNKIEVAGVAKWQTHRT
jgi:hypothetical protein